MGAGARLRPRRTRWRPRAWSGEQLEGLQLAEQGSLWLHWDRGHPQAHGWLREHSGLSDFSCDRLLLEENSTARAC